MATSGEGDVHLAEVESSNWRAVVALQAHPSQAQFVAPISYYLCLCHYGSDWHPLAILRGDDVVGHVMWAFDEDEGSYWIGGLVVDAAAQGRGVGRKALTLLLQSFTDEARGDQVALTYQADNVVARGLYASFDFVETGEISDEELVARRPLR